MDRIGFLGVGHLASALVDGLIRSGLPRSAIVLSRRGLSAGLAERHGLEIAPSNADLVAGCPTVVLAVRPGHAAEAVAGLPWRPDHVLISACAGVRLEALRGARPAALRRVMPLTAAAYLSSPTTLFPDDSRVRSLFDRLGPVIALESEDQFEVATVSAAVYGWAHRLIGQGVAWSHARGLPEAAARQLMAATFVAAGRTAADSPETLPDLLRALVTPGGITECGLDVLQAREVPPAWDLACDAVLARLAGGERGQPRGSRNTDPPLA